MNWNRKTYDALHDWVGPKKEEAKAILIAAGGQDIVDELEATSTLGYWYRLTRDAAQAVGKRVVESSAHVAEQKLAPYRRSN